MMESTVINFVISLVINGFMSHRVVLSFTSLNMWLDLVNGCLLKRSVV